MALPRFNEDVNIISKLNDEPNDVGGLSAADLKAEFDKAGVLLKAFINETLLPYLEAVTGAGSIGVTDIPGLNDAASVQAALEELKTQLNNVSTGAIPDRSLTGQKLVAGAVGEDELANDSVTAAKMVGGIVDDSKISTNKLSGASIQDGAIATAHLGSKVVTAAKVADNTLTANQMQDFTITAAKIAPDAINSSKLADSAVEEDSIAPKAVTRAKLASEVLHSPVKYINAGSESYTITAEDDGKTLETNALSSNFNINLENDPELPLGMEVAIYWLFASSVTITTSGGVAIKIPGEELMTNKTFSVPEKNTMIALKKVTTYNGLSYWALLGNVEVVS